MIVAKDGEDQVKISLPQRFQEAIDEAAMRLGEDDADSYITDGFGIPGKLWQDLLRPPLRP